MKQEIFESVENWLKTQSESEIQDIIVEMMLTSMKEPLLNSLPNDEMFNSVPAFMRKQLKDQIVVSVKAQTLICLKALISANKENTKINELIVKKHFSREAQDEGLIHVERYSEAYTAEVEEFYHKIQASDFNNVITFN